MANVVNFDRVSLGHPGLSLLDEVSLGLDDADRVGVVGLNGAGKTTLLRLLTGAEQPDTGRVTRRGGLRVGALPQAVDLEPDATVADVVVGTAWLPDPLGAEHEWAGDSTVRAVLAGLGMPGLGLDTPVGPLSGGERRRVALAALLVRPVDLLVLDEPTNHLDVAGIGWLANWLNGLRGALVVVTHDRWFLDEVCNATWEVADGSVRAYQGGYAAWTLARAERERVAAATEERRQNLLRKELAWLRRGPPARTSKPKFRIDAANALIADVPAPRDTVSLHRLATARLGRQVYDLEDVTVRVGADRVLLDDVTFRVGPGDRVALVGLNGAGKSTVLRLLAAERDADEGTVRIGQTVRAAHLSQELTELPGNLRVLEAVEEVARRVRLGDRELSAAQFAELFGFSDRRLWTVVSELSGGERRRLQLLRLLATEPNVLLLDEPTNDLDIDTLAALEDLLDSWPGTLIVASHDRYLLERVCDTVVALPGDGSMRDLPGGVDEFLSLVPSGELPAGRTVPAPAAKRSGPGDAARARAGRKELARLERQVSNLEKREAELHEALAANATDHQKLTELTAELDDVRARRAGAEEDWMVLAESLPE